MFVQKHNGRERLILRGSRHSFLHGQVCEKFFHLRRAHFARMAETMKPNGAFDPAHIGFFGARAEMLGANHGAHLVEQLGRG